MPGPNKQGPTADEIQKLRELHAALGCDVAERSPAAYNTRRRMNEMTFAQAAETPPRRRLRLPRLVHGRPWRRGGSRQPRRSSARCGSGIASTRCAARRARGSASSRARSRSTTSAPRSARTRREQLAAAAERFDERFAEALSPELERPCARSPQASARSSRSASCSSSTPAPRRACSASRPPTARRGSTAP